MELVGGCHECLIELDNVGVALELAERSVLAQAVVGGLLDSFAVVLYCLYGDLRTVSALTVECEGGGHVGKRLRSDG